MAHGIYNYADIIGFHGYVKIPALGTGAPDPAAGAACEKDLITSVQAAISGSTSKPIYDTEGSWGADSTGQGATYFANSWIRDLPTPNAAQVQAEEAAYTAIYYLIHASNTVCTPPSTSCNTMAGFSWYGWDFDNQAPPVAGSTGQFWDQYSVAFTPAGIAYKNVYSWLQGPLQGASPVAPCTVQLAGSSTAIGVWTCSFAGPGNSTALAVWDNSQTCIGGTCTFNGTFTFPAGTYTEWRDLLGNATQLPTGATSVSNAIGLQPILLDNGTLP